MSPIAMMGDLERLHSALESVEWKHLDSVLAMLADLRQLRDRDAIKRGLDKEIVREVLELLEKIRRGRAAPWNPQSQWAVIMEIIALLLKLVAKAFILQELPIPKLPPDINGIGRSRRAGSGSRKRRG